MVLGAFAFPGTLGGVMYPMVLAGAGTLASIFGTFFVNSKDEKGLAAALNRGTYISGALVIVISLIASLLILKTTGPFVATIAGLIAGIIIGLTSQYYTASDYKPVKELAENSKTGPATVIINGLALVWKALSSYGVGLCALWWLIGQLESMVLLLLELVCSPLLV